MHQTASSVKIRANIESLSSRVGIVVGDRGYRIVYRVNPDGSVVMVWVIGRSSDDEVYHLTMSRLRLHPDEAAREFAVALDDIWHG